MNILVNTRLLLYGKMEGIGFYTHQLMQKVVKNHPEHTFYFLFDRPYHQDFVYASNVIPLVYGPPARHPFLYIIWFEITVPKVIKKYKIDAFFSPDHFLSIRAKVPTILAVHDLNFMHNPENLPLLTSLYYRLFFPHFIKKAKQIIAVSEYTKNDIIQYFKIPSYNIDVVYNASNQEKGKLNPQQIFETKKKISSGKDYFFYIGSLHKRKNIGRMLLAFDDFINKTKADVNLIIGGRAMWSDKEMEKDYQKVVHKEKIIFTGRLSNEDAKLLMGSSLALVFVSLFEGFGVPIVEAMESGVPVITSNVTSMPEIAADAACLVNPLSVNEISDAMMLVYQDEKYRNDLIDKGLKRANLFSWEISAQRCWDAFEKMLNK
ncbi:MAG TPA: glycosyltransferase family 1 protein [Bacteroidales bacterium]|nr:glycosyltransferase family 1 protein [Bacteroidales bacterium]